MDDMMNFIFFLFLFVQSRNNFASWLLVPIMTKMTGTCPSAKDKLIITKLINTKNVLIPFQESSKSINIKIFYSAILTGPGYEQLRQNIGSVN